MHLMIDLLTMSTRASAAIVRIGAVAFDGSSILDEFDRGVTLGTAIETGGHVDGDTLEWWLYQEKAARMGLFHHPKEGLPSALFSFAAWVGDLGEVEGVWGNGATFDNVVLTEANVVLTEAYLRLGLRRPWSYKVDRCFRTMRAMYPWVEEPPFEGTEHKALDDARHQALWLQAIWKEVGR
jgi:hypothetical protein